MSTARTIVEYFAEHEAYRCGYCGSSDTNYSHGMWAHTMTVQDYEDLLNRGWRRSGKYTYKPTMNVTCCPMYPIRCEVLKFQMRKSHKKVIKRVNKFLIDGIRPSDNTSLDMTEAETASKDGKQTTTKQGSTDASQSTSSKPAETKKEKHVPRPGEGADPSKPKQKKAKELRKAKKAAKLAAKGIEATPMDQTACSKRSDTEGKTLEDFLDEPDRAAKCAHKLEIRLVRTSPPSEEFEASLAESHEVYHRYQMKIHGDKPDKPSMKQYTRFLVDSPLQPDHTPKEGNLPMGFGSFHQQYLLDGKIICVGVIDILPSLVSSKYLYYDPDYDFLSLGTYSALREIAFVRDLHRQCADMLYYYMGYYIQSCPKMRYKGQYFPSFLSCPETYTWYPVEKCAPLLEANKYSRFADDTKEDADKEIDLDQVLVLYNQGVMPYYLYKQLKFAVKKQQVNDRDTVMEYAGFVGKTCSQRILLFRK